MRGGVLRLGGWALLLLMLALPGWAGAERRALLVGCDRFVSQADTSPSAAEGVRQVAAALGGDLSRVVSRPGGVSGVDELSELVQEAFAGAAAGDISYFYICTHGIWNSYEPAEGMTLVLSDGEGEEGITAAGLKEIFDRVSGVKVLILDACHSGAMIGKGLYAPFLNLFAGEEYKVICSSGAREDSWFWRGMTEEGSEVIGGGYFSGALARGLGEEGGFAADLNQNGEISLSEMKRYLRLNHGASTVHSYPEEDDFVLLRYDPEENRRGPALRQLMFETGAVEPGWEISLSFTIARRVRVAYQLIYEENGRWDFASAPLIWDDEEELARFGLAPGWLEPGFKERRIALSPEAGEGYVLLQVLTQGDDGLVTVAGSTVLCVRPREGDPQLMLTAEAAFCPALGDELSAVVGHSLPCELTVTVEDETGTTVARLLSAEPTRPEHLSPQGTAVGWTGRLPSGETAPPGLYRLRARTRVGSAAYTALSDWIKLEENAGIWEEDGE